MAATAGGLTSTGRLARCFATASRLAARSFATAGRLARSFAASGVAAVVLAEDLAEQAFQLASGLALVAARIDDFAATSGLTRSFATATRNRCWYG